MVDGHWSPIYWRMFVFFWLNDMQTFLRPHQTILERICELFQVAEDMEMRDEIQILFSILKSMGRCCV